MYLDHLGHWRWEKQDLKKHGTLAKYLVGECRCRKCEARILEPDEEVSLPPRYNSG